VVDRVRALPGVRAASLSIITPLSGAGMDVRLTVEGRSPEPGVMGYANRVSEDYFSSMGTRMLLGRDFEPRDAGAVVPVAVVNEALVRQHFRPESDLAGES
jgi:hypothetical protein